MNKEERENKIVEEFHCSGHSEDTFTAFRDGWLCGYIANKNEEYSARVNTDRIDELFLNTLRGLSCS